jgi:peptidoglycan/xylan/chitin deacetylase (PgdA/CDA1 family)
MLVGAVKSGLKALLATPTGWRLSAPLRHDGVVAITYHRINPDRAAADGFPGMPLSQFEAQMDWLKQHCEPIWPEQIFEAAQRKARARPAVVVTFDDGYRDYHDRAYPILRRLEIPSVVFLSTALIDEGGLIWTESIHRAVMLSTHQIGKLPGEGRHAPTYPLGSLSQKLTYIRDVKAYLKGVANDVRKKMVENVWRDLGVTDPTAGLERQMLNWDEVRATMSGTRFGGHSHTHPIMSKLTPEETQQEIHLCRQRIWQETGVAPTTFAFPNGRAIDFNETAKNVLREHGFNLAFTTIQGAITERADALALPRQHTGANDVGSFAALLARP